MLRSVRPYLEQAEIEDPVVCYQGAAVADPVTGAFLRHVPVPLHLAREVLDALAELGIHVNAYVDDNLYVDEVNAYAEAYAGFQRIPVNAVGDLRRWLAEPPTKLVAVAEPHRLAAVRPALEARFGGRLFVSGSLPEFLEFASPDVSKGAGLAFVARRLGFSLDRTVAFGDGENDVELLEAAGYRVAVAGAHPRLVALADLVCPGPNEHGVAQLLEALVDSTP
jgi:Cof subfamily protein (haloacid dehalogenase superfamily)